MKHMRFLNEGESLKTGDIIEIDTGLTHRAYPVIRVSKKYVFVQWSSTAEGRFPTVYTRWFRVLPYDAWDRSVYTVKRDDPIEAAYNRGGNDHES